MKKSFIVVFLCTFMIMSFSSLSHAQRIVRQLSDNDVKDFGVRINAGGQVVWTEAYADTSGDIILYDGTSTLVISSDVIYGSWYADINDAGHVVWEGGSDIYLYDGADTHRLTFDYQNNLPQINNNGHVVWEAFHDGDTEIMFYDGATTVPLTDSSYNESQPRINDSGYVAWVGFNPDGEIFLYDGATATQLTDNTHVDQFQRMNDSGQIVWQGGDCPGCEIYFFDGTSTIQLTDNFYDDREPRINNAGHVVWWGYHDAILLVFLYDGTTTTLLAEDAKEPDISDAGYVVWQGLDGSDWDIFLYDGATTVRITEDSLYDDEYPVVSDAGHVAWERNDGSDKEIMLSVPIVVEPAQWALTLEGELDHGACSVAQSSDGGYIVAGETGSFGAGGSDVWVVKFDSTGSVEWQRTYGGPDDESAAAILQTGYEGYIVAGKTRSYGAGGSDVWVVKLSAAGDVEWQRAYGGPEGDWATSIEAAEPMGYIVSATTNSFGAGESDLWLLKLDPSGAVEWQKTYGGPSTEFSGSIERAREGGYILGSETYSFDLGNGDFWVVKVDAAGAVEWQKAFGLDTGNENTDYAPYVLQTEEGGYIVAGESAPVPSGNLDAWVLKLDSAGAIQWQKRYNTIGDYRVSSIWETPGPGGYMVSGRKGALVGLNPIGDGWLMKLDGSGDLEWQNLYGGGEEMNYDTIFSAGPAFDGGAVAAGTTETFGAGERSLWVLKVDENGSIPDCPIVDAWSGSTEETFEIGIDSSATVTDTSVAPVDTSAAVQDTVSDEEDVCTPPVEELFVLWERTIGGSGNDVAFDMLEAEDGGFVLAGYSSSIPSYAGSDDAWLVKTDARGHVEWEQRFADWSGDPSRNESAQAIVHSGDGGYIVTGLTGGGTTDTDLWLFKTDAAGAPAWARKYGGGYYDEGYSVTPAHGAGYIVGGMTSAGGLDRDLWLIKTHADGTLDWEQVYDEPGPDYCKSVAMTSDGGYIATGHYEMSGDGPLPLIKTDGSGVEVWSQEWTDSYPQDNFGHWAAEADDGGFVVAGAYEEEVSLMKVSAGGAKEWEQYYGGENDGLGYAAAKTLDGGYIIAGVIYPAPGDDDIYLVKTDEDGDLQWEMTFGTTSTYESARAILPLADGSYVILANQAPHLGTKHDVLLIKIGPDEPVEDFGLVSPENGASLIVPPTLEWYSGDYDLFRLYTVFNYPSIGYYTVSFWLSDTTYKIPDSWWNAIATGVPSYWTVLGYNTGTGAWELGAVWSFTKF